MVVVYKRKGETEDRLIARFKKGVYESWVIQEFRDRLRFVSNSQRKQIKHKRKKFLILLEKRNNRQ